MRATRIQMGMPVTVEVVGSTDPADLERVFEYFDRIDRKFSTYRNDSEISAINTGALTLSCATDEMREILLLAEMTRRETGGYFDIRTPGGKLDPSGVVKGWAVRNAASLLTNAGLADFFVDAGGDVQSSGRNAQRGWWTIGIRSPFDPNQIIKVIRPRGRGVATSGTYVRGQHIYNPHAPGRAIDDILSLTVIAADVCEADRFATAAFAMGRPGIHFLERIPGIEAYAVWPDGRATMTSGFQEFVA